MKCFPTASWLLLLPLLLLAGCQNGDDIASYSVDRPKSKEQERLLGAILLQKEGASWFFKFVAPATVVKEHQEAVAALINSIHLEDKADAVPTWKLPEGWQEEDVKADIRYKTLRFGPNHELVLTVSRSRGDLLSNVNRWLGEESQNPARSEEELRENKIVREGKVNGRTVYLVDITGTKARRPAMGGPMRPPQQPALGEIGNDPKFDVPAGWKQVKPADGFTRIAFRLPDAPEGKPEVTISALGGTGGGLLGNYQRWQRQIDLPPSENLPGDLKTLKVAGQEAEYVDLLGPAGKDQQRLLVVVVKHDGHTWYFKLLAGAELVAKQQAAFEAFVKSVRF